VGTTDVTALRTAYGWELLPHPAYSPDTSPCDYNLFMKLKEQFRGRRFPTLEELNSTMSRRIRELNSSGALDGIKNLPQCWRRVIQYEGGVLY